MSEYRMRFVILTVAVMLSVLSTASAGTWRLEKGRDLKVVSAEGQDKFLVAVAEAKKFVNTGQTKAASKAYDALKKDFPEIAGPDLDIFIKAEIYYCKGDFTKAVRNYNKLLTEFPQSKLTDAALDREFAIATANWPVEKRHYSVSLRSKDMPRVSGLWKRLPTGSVSTHNWG